MRGAMTHRERILAAVTHQPTDRVPTDYWGVPEITDTLYKHFGVSDSIGLARALDIDMVMRVEPILKPGRRNMWNIENQRIPVLGGLGYYEEPVEFPIAKYDTIGEIEANYIWPTTDMYDYSTIKSQCELLRREHFAIEGGYISLAYFYQMIRGVEQSLLDFAGDEELAEYILYKINAFASAHSRRILEEADGLVDLSQVTDDFGAQGGLLMSPEMIERYLGRYYEENNAMVKSFGAHVFHHDDGAIMQLVPWIVKKGAEVLNPLQWHLPGWDLYELKKKYGNALCFHGGIDNQHVLPFGGTEDVKEEVRACMDALYRDRTGYILAPCHCVQINTPIENILTMYDYAKKYSAE